MWGMPSFDSILSHQICLRTLLGAMLSLIYGSKYFDVRSRPGLFTSPFFDTFCIWISKSRRILFHSAVIIRAWRISESMRHKRPKQHAFTKIFYPSELIVLLRTKLWNAFNTHDQKSGRIFFLVKELYPFFD